MRRGLKASTYRQPWTWRYRHLVLPPCHVPARAFVQLFPPPPLRKTGVSQRPTAVPNGANAPEAGL